MSRALVLRLATAVLAALASMAVFAVSTGTAAAGKAKGNGNGSSSGTCASSADKCFAVTVSPATAPAGSMTTFQFTVTNDAPTQSLGSAEITAPSGFAITGASVPSGVGTVSSSSTSARFLDLGVAPGGSTTLDVTATAPCALSGGTGYTWGIVVKQSNNFSGPPGNDFYIEPQSMPALSGSLSGSCSLAFVPTAEPASTTVSSPILTGPDSTGGPVAVEVLGTSSQLVTTSDASITLSLLGGASGAKLSGGTATAVGGIAAFSDLKVNTAAPGYQLEATSPGISASPPAPLSDVSSAFTIYDSMQPCVKGTSCSTTGSSSKTTTSATANTGGGYLGLGFGGVSLTCSGYTSVSSVVTYDVLSSSGASQSSVVSTVTLEIAKSLVQSSGHPGASSWQICYGSPTQFPVVSGTGGTTTIGGQTWYTGLLQSCSNTPVAPCVLAQNKDNAGDVVVTFLATGDPVYRG